MLFVEAKLFWKVAVFVSTSVIKCRNGQREQGALTFILLKSLPLVTPLVGWLVPGIVLGLFHPRRWDG